MEIKKEVVLTLELRGGKSPRSPANMRSTVASSLGILSLLSWFSSEDGYSIYHFYHFKSLREAFPAVRQPPYFRRAVGGAFVRYWINSIELHGKSFFAIVSWMMETNAMHANCTTKGWSTDKTGKLERNGFGQTSTYGVRKWGNN